MGKFGEDKHRLMEQYLLDMLPQITVLMFYNLYMNL